MGAFPAPISANVMITAHCPRTPQNFFLPAPALSSAPEPISARRLSPPPPLGAAAAPRDAVPLRPPATSPRPLTARPQPQCCRSRTALPPPHPRSPRSRPVRGPRGRRWRAGGRRTVPPARHGTRRPDTHSCTAPRGSRSGSRLSSRRLQATRCPAQRQGAGQRAAAGRPPSSSGSRSSAGRTASAERGRRSMAGSEPLPALPSLAFPPLTEPSAARPPASQRGWRLPLMPRSDR